MKKTKLSIVIPCHNEAANIEPLYKEIYDTFKNRNEKIELVFINDGSKDTTLKELKNILTKKDFEIKVISFSRNFGKDAAMYAGLENSTGDLVCIIDADLQQKPSLIVPMIEALEANEEYDSVCYFQENRIESNLITRLKSSFYKMMTKISDIEFVDGASDFRLFKRQVVNSILSLKESNRFSKGIFNWVGYNTCYLPYTPEARRYGKSSYSMWKLVMYALSGIISFSTLPLSIATVGGVISAAICLFYILIVVFQKIFLTIDVPGYPTLLVTILLIGSLILCCLGIIGEYVARIYMETKKRPLYVEKEILTNNTKKETK